MKSINQMAQESGDTSANEAQRIRDREAAVRRAWRSVAYLCGEESCTAEIVARTAALPVDYVRFVCGTVGYRLV